MKVKPCIILLLNTSRKHVNYEEDKNKVSIPMNKPYNIQNTNICNGIFHISFFKALLINEGETTHWANRIRGKMTRFQCHGYNFRLLWLFFYLLLWFSSISSNILIIICCIPFFKEIHRHLFLSLTYLCTFSSGQNVKPLASKDPSS